jgi:hypothetical protein
MRRTGRSRSSPGDSGLCRRPLHTDPHARLGSARYAHTASYQLRAPYDPVTRRASLTYAEIPTEQRRVP